MSTITRTISTSFDKVTRRIVKVLRFGKTDVKTAIETAPYGIDSNPIAGMRAIYCETDQKGKNVICGYINENQLADTGECRLYSTDDQGNLKTFVWLKKDGTMQIGGSNDNAVRFSPLKTATDKLATDIQAELVKIAAGIVAGGGTYTPGTISIDISNAKINEVETP